MRPMLALGILMLGLNSAAPEPEYSSLFGDYFHALRGGGFPSLVEIESSTSRGDRLAVAALQPRALPVEILKRRTADPVLTLASASADVDIGPAAAMRAALETDMVTGTVTGADANSSRNIEVSIDGLCNAVLASAQENDLPIPFFANLLWQESRLRNDAVSPKGAQGIAQFMPTTAAETGLDNPFDPLQAIPASARLLNELRLQFGNLGFVAAAYNAGAHRVAEWLEHRRDLPRETRNYVVRVTGLSAEAWRKIPVDDAVLTFARPLPCRNLPAFASMEQERMEQTQLAQAKLEAAQAAAAVHDAAGKAADRMHGRQHVRHEAHRAAHDRHSGKREAGHHPSAAHEKRKTA